MHRVEPAAPSVSQDPHRPVVQRTLDEVQLPRGAAVWSVNRARAQQCRREAVPRRQQLLLQRDLPGAVGGIAGPNGLLGLRYRHRVTRKPVRLVLGVEAAALIVLVHRAAGDDDGRADPVGEAGQLLCMGRSESGHVHQHVTSVAERRGQRRVVLPVGRQCPHLPRPAFVTATTARECLHLPAVRGERLRRDPPQLSCRSDDDCVSPGHGWHAKGPAGAGPRVIRRAHIRSQLLRRGNFFAGSNSAFTSAAYRSTYSWPDSSRIAYMISSVIARITAFSFSMPS